VIYSFEVAWVLSGLRGRAAWSWRRADKVVIRALVTGGSGGSARRYAALGLTAATSTCTRTAASHWLKNGRRDRC